MIPQLALKIKPEFDNRVARKNIAEQSKQLADQKKTVTELGKAHSKILKDTTKGLKDTAVAAERAGFTFKSAFRGAKQELEQFGKGVETLKSKLISLKTFVVGSAIGGLAVAGINKLLTGGQAEQKAIGRINREFGTDAKAVRAQADRIARLAGISREDALKAIIPIGEAVQETQAGTVLRGRRLTAAGAAGVRRQTLGVGGDLLTRIATVTGGDPQEIAQVLAEAGSGPEGVRRFASVIGGNRVFARELNAANEKGQLAKFLSQRGYSAAKLTSLGVKSGQVAGSGTVLDLIAQQSGITDEAAAAKRRSFGFQRQSMMATIDNTLGEIGATALDKLTKSLGKGKTLAEKFQEALESDKGKKVIDGIASGIDRMVQGAIKLATALPQAFKWIEDHKTLLLTVAGGFGVFKAGQLGIGAFKGTKSVLNAFGIGGGKGGLLEAAMGGTKPIPVYIVNAPGGIGGVAGSAGGASGLLAKAGLVAGAGVAGYAFGKWVDSKTGLSTKIANGLDFKSAAKENAGVLANQAALMSKGNARSALVKQFEAAGLSHFQAISVVDNKGGVNFGLTSQAASLAQQAFGISVQPTIVVQLDGKTISTHTAAATIEHIQRKVSRDTAGGVAPTAPRP